MVSPDKDVFAGSSINGLAATAVAFISITIYNFIELNFIIFATFKRHSGLYFWSFIAATWALAPQAVGLLLKDLSLSRNPYIYITLLLVSWPVMVTGQSLVLYSRLHLVVSNRTILRSVLTMIIFNAIICHVPAIFLLYIIQSSPQESYLVAYAIHERIQVTIFFVQECTISGLYIWKTVKLRKLENGIHSYGSARRIMLHLLIVNIIVILLDTTIITLEFIGLYYIQTTWKAMVYSVKLKLEFSILNKLVQLFHEPTNRTLTERDLIGTNGIAIETLRSDKRSRHISATARGIQYSASVRAENGTSTESGGITMTTDICIQNERQSEDAEHQQSPESLDVETGSALAAERVVIVRQDRMRRQPSSQVNLIRSQSDQSGVYKTEEG
ncbi:hypothetical protein F5884DRAFT_506204 [Xylogone sp. PMI_703]|nr:hypothetical protein F5884DRAFT_506204 [Xylogone sp. PMI_703]